MKSIRSTPSVHGEQGDERIRTAARWLGAVLAYVRCATGRHKWAYLGDYRYGGGRTVMCERCGVRPHA